VFDDVLPVPCIFLTLFQDVGASSTKAVILPIREHTELKENKERGIKLKLKVYFGMAASLRL
jgi:hypothetical protein